MQSASSMNSALLLVLKTRAVVPRVCKKAESMACAKRHTGQKSPFFTLQPVIILDKIRIGEQWVEVKGGGVQNDHRGREHRRESDCSTLSGKARETFPRCLRSEERRAGKECLRLWSARWAPGL